MKRPATAMQRITSFVALVLMTALTLAACSSSGSSQSGGPISLSFWAAPNPPQQAFWAAMAKAYMAQHTGVHITVRAMPESPSSEAGIQSALAGGTAPTASENIFTGFASQLVHDQAIVPLDQMPGWDNVLSTSHMTQTIQGWKSGDNHTYVLPLYTNAILVAWRSDILKQLGYNQPPQTYSQLLTMGQKLKQKFPNKFVWADSDLVQDTWWQRWFDFFTLYDAASNGQSLIHGNTISANDQAALATLGFLRDLKQNNLLLTQTATDPFENGVSLMSIIGPWQFTTWAQKYPNLKLNTNFVLSPPPVPDSYPTGQPVKTFADAKGVVIYKQASADQQAAMWEFLKWVFSDPQHAVQWMQATNLPSARDDLDTNPAFQTYLHQHPELAAFAQNIPNAVPPLQTPKYTDIQVALGDDAVIPVVKGQATPEQGWNSWKSAIQSLLS